MPRSYRSEIRRDRAAQTRRAAIDAAVEVFAERGWSGTTMPMIAARAGIAVETVYRVVDGGKAGLLEAAVHAALAGGAAGSEVPTDERPGIHRVIEAPSAEAAIRQYAALLPASWSRVAPLLATLESARGEGALADLSHALEEQRLAGMRRFAAQLDRMGPLRHGLDPARAADILWTICSRANYDALIRRGWTPHAYTDWITQTLTSTLLDPGQPVR